MEFNEKKFISGFNNGYLLAQYEQSTLNLLLNSINPTTSYIKGMQLGQKQYEQEQMKERLNELAQVRKEERRKDLDRHEL